jgi:hypothetical protein
MVSSQCGSESLSFCWHQDLGLHFPLANHFHTPQFSMQDSTGSQILEINEHQVPAIAYRRIIELWRRGLTESEITQEVKTMCNKNSGAISEVVLSAINDQKFASTFPSEISGDEYLHKSDIRFFFSQFQLRS